MNPNDIRGLWIRYDEEEDTYSIDIETSSYTVSYPKTKIQFSCGDNIAFPIAIKILNEHDNVVNNYSLTHQYNQSDQLDQDNQDGIQVPEE